MSNLFILRNHMHIFVDESGQFHKNHADGYFVIAAFTVGYPKRTDKQFRSWCQSKFPKKMRFRPEIKFSDSGITDELKVRTVEYLAHLDIRIRYAFLKKQNIPDEYKRKERIESGLLYTKIIAETLEMFTPTNDLVFHVFCDQRKLKGVTKKQFIQNVEAHLLPSLPSGAQVRIQMVNSSGFPNVQIADWVVGAIASYLHKKPLGDVLYSVLQQNIIGSGKEMFPDHWEQKVKDQKTQSGD